MMLELPSSEVLIRLGSFLGIFLVVALWEVFAPRRALTLRKSVRWLNNLALVALNSLLLRLLFPITAVALASWVEAQQWGLLNQVALPTAFELLLAVALLDFAIYWQHRIFHIIPMLWNLHRIHHADMDYDLTTGLRFHPIEILLSMLIKFAVILLLGPSALAVLIFETLLNGCAIFNHGNIRLPLILDHWLRWLIVTPDMHRIHHSIHRYETDSNYGFCLSLWDRLFSSYRHQPQDGHLTMILGLANLRSAEKCTQLPELLKLPFIKLPTSNAANIK